MRAGCKPNEKVLQSLRAKGFAPCTPSALPRSPQTSHSDPFLLLTGIISQPIFSNFASQEVFVLCLLRPVVRRPWRIQNELSRRTQTRGVRARMENPLVKCWSWSRCKLSFFRHATTTFIFLFIWKLSFFRHAKTIFIFLFIWKVENTIRGVNAHLFTVAATLQNMETYSNLKEFHWIFCKIFFQDHGKYRNYCGQVVRHLAKCEPERKHRKTKRKVIS